MTLLSEIESDVTNSTVELSDVLRKAKRLARRLQEDELESWVERELQGYDGIRDEDMPVYRKALTESYGEVVMSTGIAKDVTRRVPQSRTPPALTWPGTMYFRERVSELGALSRTGGGQGVFAQDWPHNLVEVYSRVMRVRLLRAYKVVSPAQIASVLD